MENILRPLRESDAPYMLEWMHDPDAVSGLRTDFASRTINDCTAFIASSLTGTDSCHLAITDMSDEYLGTCSLKNIDRTMRTAEFGIVIRRCAMGTGIAQKAMRQIIEYGFDELDLDRIFWCVDPVNKRAMRFYDKNGYHRADAGPGSDVCDAALKAGYTQEEVLRYSWYEIVRGGS